MVFQRLDVLLPEFSGIPCIKARLSVQIGSDGIIYLFDEKNGG